MSVFTWTPDFDASEESKPAVSQIKFGDGYEQRFAQGINSDLKKWTVKFSLRNQSEADAIKAFFEARAAVESFDWTPPLALAASKYVCRAWSRVLNKPNLFTISATFEEVAEP